MVETEEIESRQGDRPFLQAEELEIRSGKMLLVDQFMLGNAQFQRSLGVGGAPDGVLPENHLRDFGAAVVSLDPGRWKVFRFPREQAFIICRMDTHEDVLPAMLEEALHAFPPGKAPGKERVYIETRCIVFLDWQLVRDADLLEKFSSLRKAGRDKEARDLLRESGAAVRYGFSQDSDELGIFVIEPEGAIVMTRRPTS